MQGVLLTEFMDTADLLNSKFIGEKRNSAAVVVNRK
jgi:hypothetical protein